MPWRAPRADCQAITAPLAIMLLIVIVVGLAWAITLFGQRLSDEAGDQDIPDVAFTTDQSQGHEVTVVRAEGGLDWVRDLRISGSCTPLLNGAPYPSSEGTPVVAGNILSCEAGETLAIRSSPAYGNALLFSVRF